MGKDMSLKMAEELKKYRDILDHKGEEFKKQLEREVSISWFFQVNQRNRILN